MVQLDLLFEIMVTLAQPIPCCTPLTSAQAEYLKPVPGARGKASHDKATEFLVAVDVTSVKTDGVVVKVIPLQSGRPGFKSAITEYKVPGVSPVTVTLSIRPETVVESKNTVVLAPPTGPYVIEGTVEIPWASTKTLSTAEVVVTEVASCTSELGVPTSNCGPAEL